MSDEETPPEELEHHGVKGQKWGVRRDLSRAGQAFGREAAQLNDKSKEYLSIIGAQANKTLTRKEATAQLTANKEKFAQKFGPSDGPINGPGKGLSPAQKRFLIGAGVGVAVVGGLYLMEKYDVGGYTAHTNKVQELLKIRHPPGQPVSVAKFDQLVQKSQLKTWGFSANGFITEESFARPAFSLPKGHTFYRISTTAENGFRIPPGTYCVSSIEDFHRYVVGFSKEKGGAALHQVKFTSTNEIKVPHITDVLESVREVLNAEGKGQVSQKDAINAYKAMSGGGWSGVREQNLFTSLARKGFGAIVDEMDAGVIGEKPLVVFSENFSTKTSQPFNKAIINAAAANLTEIGWRK